jgi:hypothetical protein
MKDIEVLFLEKDNLIVNTYYVILGSLSYRLIKKRNLLTMSWRKSFFFFFKFYKIIPVKVSKDAEVLQKTYLNNLATSYVNKYV